MSGKAQTDPNTGKSKKLKKKKKVEHSTYEDNLLSVEDRYKLTRYSFDVTPRVEGGAGENEEEDSGKGTFGLCLYFKRKNSIHTN